MPAVFTVTRVAAAPHLLRLKIIADLSTDPGSVLITNAQLMAGPLAMAAGPLKTIWNVSGLTLAQAVDRCLEGARSRIYAISTNFLPVCGITVTVDGDGRPQLFLDFPIKDFSTTLLISLEFRHSIDR